MPKSKNKRKNGGKGGSSWAKRVDKINKEQKAKEQAELGRITREILG